MADKLIYFSIIDCIVACEDLVDVNQDQVADISSCWRSLMYKRRSVVL